MEWWVILLLVIVILFVIGVIWFSFVYPHKIKKQKIEKIMSTEPEKLIRNVNDVRFFKHYKINELDSIGENKDLEKPGICGLYVSGRIEDNAYIYPIYLIKAKNVKKEMFNLKQQIVEKDNNLNKLFNYLERTKKNIDKVRIFYINDLDIDKYNYWKQFFEIDNKSFN